MESLSKTGRVFSFVCLRIAMGKIKFEFVPDNGFVGSVGRIVLTDHVLDPAGKPRLSPDCIDAAEVASYVKARRAELDAVLIEAARQFKKSN